MRTAVLQQNSGHNKETVQVSSVTPRADSENPVITLKWVAAKKLELIYHNMGKQQIMGLPYSSNLI